jgi:hypothetical protein
MSDGSISDNAERRELICLCSLAYLNIGLLASRLLLTSISDDSTYNVLLLDELAAVVSDNELPSALRANNLRTSSHQNLQEDLRRTPPSS